MILNTVIILTIVAVDWTRTSDLRVMGPTSYQLLHPACNCTMSLVSSLSSDHSVVLSTIISHNALKEVQFVGKTGFEPATPCSQSKCANRTALLPYLSGYRTTLSVQRNEVSPCDYSG